MYSINRTLFNITRTVVVQLVTFLMIQSLSHATSTIYFEVSLQQHGKIIPIENHQAVLDKQAFTLLLTFRQPESVLVNASLTPESFERAVAGAPLEEIPGFRDLGMAEDPFNSRVALMVSNRAPHFWYYANETDHRFNEVIHQDGKVICKRIVANIMYRETSKQYFALKDIREQTLYLVFMKTTWTSDYRQQIEQQRDYLKIVLR